MIPNILLSRPLAKHKNSSDEDDRTAAKMNRAAHIATIRGVLRHRLRLQSSPSRDVVVVHAATTTTTATTISPCRRYYHPSSPPASSSAFSATSHRGMAMKPGSPIPGLDKIYPAPKDGGPSRAPVALSRNEYPPWVSELTRPLPTLAKLRGMKVEDASDKDMKRYLKLVRKARIKSNNESRAKN